MRLTAGAMASKAAIWVLFLAVVFGLFKGCAAIGNPWSTANVMAPVTKAQAAAASAALSIPGCADKPECGK